MKEKKRCTFSDYYFVSLIYSPTLADEVILTRQILFFFCLQTLMNVASGITAAL